MDEVNQPIPTLQTPDQMNSSFENSSSSKVIPFIIVAVLLVLVGAGGYILGTKKTQTVVENKVTTQSSPTFTPTPDPTANWQTYTSTKYNFSVKYPANLEVQESRTDQDVSFYGISGDPQSGNCTNIKVNVHTMDSEKMKEWITRNRVRTQSGTNVIIPKEYFPYANAIDKAITGFWVESGSETVGKHIFVQKENRFVEFSIQGCGAGDSYKYHPEVLQITDQMVATFKFIP